MGSVFSWIRQLGPAGFVLKAIVGSLIGIGLLLAFILGRRAVRRRYFRRRNARTFVIRKNWEAIVGNQVPPEKWRFERLDCEIIETIALDRLEVAPAAEGMRLLGLLRSSGLLDMRIYEARTLRGWRRRRALVTLGRTRAPEAIAALSEALDDPDLETRVAAVRGLSRAALPEAAVPLLEQLIAGGLHAAAVPLQNALLNCCRSQPALLVSYLNKAQGKTRELLARVLGEVATPELEDELLLLAGDPQPEVRASAARALAQAKSHLALPILSQLATDPEWFVRLRAVVGLGALATPQSIPPLIRALCDANRMVRLRAAAALVPLEPHLEQILVQVVETHDRYALQAMISELERSGGLPKLVDALANTGHSPTAASLLLEALDAGARQLRGARTPAEKPQEVAR